MAIYRMTTNELEPLAAVTFAGVNVSERGDLQRLLKRKIEIIAPDVLIIAEEFSDWEDSRRRIDLLGIDSAANLVVIELKRTEDGGHMELQAIRYAAMVSTLSFDRVVQIFAAYLLAEHDPRDARTAILDHLGWDEPDEELFAQAVQIVLASAEFSIELTTAVLWLNEQGLDIRCVRIKPYGSRENLLLDVQQVIPLPEARDYQVRLKDKKQRERESRSTSRDTSRFNVTINGELHPNLAKRWAVFTVVRAICASGVSPAKVSEVLSWRPRLFLSVDGTVDSAGFRTLALQQSAAFDTIRWFCADSELIHSDGRTYALTNQWGTPSESAIQQLLEAFPTLPISIERAV